MKIEIAIQPLTRVATEFPEAMRPRGVISLSAWRGMLVTLDYSRWKIGIEPGMLPEPNQKDVFALNASGELRLPMSLGGQAIDCHVDPWFPNALLVPAASTHGLELIGEPRDQGMIRTKEATPRVREGRLASEVVLGPFEVKTPLVLLAESGNRYSRHPMARALRRDLRPRQRPRTPRASVEGTRSLARGRTKNKEQRTEQRDDSKLEQERNAGTAEPCSRFRSQLAVHQFRRSVLCS